MGLQCGRRQSGRQDLGESEVVGIVDEKEVERRRVAAIDEHGPANQIGLGLKMKKVVSVNANTKN